MPEESPQLRRKKMQPKQPSLEHLGSKSAPASETVGNGLEIDN